MEDAEKRKRLGEEQRAKPMQKGIPQATESIKPVPPAPVAGESQMNRTAMSSTFMKLPGKDRRKKKKPNK